MAGVRDRLLSLWGRALSLSWPVAVQQTLSTLMRTTDILVTGFFSPAALAAVGLADLYAQIPLRIGFGLGSGAIALSSQDTGRGAAASRDRAVTQALLIGALAGLPFALAGLPFGHLALAVLGASGEVARLGGTYLAIVFAAAPMRIVGLVGSQALQGTGDTRTPMYVSVVSNLLNIGLSVGLGLGVGPFPRLGIVGVGAATALSRTVNALALLAAIRSGTTAPAFARPRDLTITRQLVAVSVPNVAEGLSTTLAEFPFNAILLGFGTEVTAAYHVGRRVYQQVGGPFYRSYSVAASVIVGQALGADDAARARFSGYGMAALGALTLGLAGVVLFVAAPAVASLFTEDAATAGYAVAFTRTYAVALPFFGLSYGFTGALRSAGDTRTPFYARLVSTLVFMLAVPYLVGVRLGYGLPAAYAGLAAMYGCRALINAVGFTWGGWAETAASLIDERADASETG